MELTEAPLGPISAILPYKGREAALSEALDTAHGMTLPPQNRFLSKGQASVMWFGRGQFLLTGADPGSLIAPCAAISDQSDAWAVMSLRGRGGAEVAARLVPVDLRIAAFPVGAILRCEIQHMAGAVARTGPDSLRFMVFRSMSATLVHDLKTAMEAVAARG